MTPRPSGAWATVLEQCGVQSRHAVHPVVVVTSDDDRTTKHNVGCIERARRAADAGLEPEYDTARRLWLVPSLSGRNRARYQAHVLAHPLAGLASATCTCEAGHNQAPQGSSPCWHGAAALIEAQLLDLVEFDGRVWWLTDLGRELAAAEEARQPARPATHVDGPAYARPLPSEVKPGTADYDRMVSQLVD